MVSSIGSSDEPTVVEISTAGSNGWCILPSSNRRRNFLSPHGLDVCRALHEQPVVLNGYTAGSAHDAVAKTGIVFTVGSYTGPKVKVFIAAGRSPRRDPSGHKPVVIKLSVAVTLAPGAELH